jgi:hypothetical protein
MAGAKHPASKQGRTFVFPFVCVLIALQYDRIDPADVQSLKDEIERLKTLVAEGETAKSNQDKAFLEQQEHVSCGSISIILFIK